MFAFAFYLLKVIICSGILFGYYWFLLRDKIFHRYNRFYLLAAIALSLALPLIEISIWHNANQPAPQSIQLLQAVNSSEYLDEIVIIAQQTNFTTDQAMLLFYSITSLVFLSLFTQALLKIRTLFIKHPHRFVENVWLINTTAKGTPFSFLKYIFWNDHIDPESPTGHQIFKHELAHVQQKHSYDKLFLNAVLIFFWCNPFYWLIRKELNIIHEFMADKIAVEDSDTEAFATMILQATYPQHRFNLSSPFFYSPIKRRLMMLTKNRNPKVGYIGRLMVLPLTVVVFAAFTLKAKTFKQSTQSYDGKTITVVIDAGHGGYDAGARSIVGNIVEKYLTLAIIKKIKAFNKNASVNIILTRENDIFQSVVEKANFTKQQNPDLFISMHIDGTTKEQANLMSGMSVWVAKNNYANSNMSKLFASAIINEFSNHYQLPVVNLPQQREIGVKILQESPCPSVLIEAGYITNEKDLAYLQTEEAKESIAKNILAAIERYAFAKESSEKAIVVLPLASEKKLTTNRKTDTIPEIALKNQEKSLIIVDGKTISYNEFKKIDPDKIKTVHVIKDKVGIAQYGDKGKNGVIIIETKMKETDHNGIKIVIRSKDSAAGIVLSNLNSGLKNDGMPAVPPLYVIDGKVAADGFKINSIDPNDIESINVIKNEGAVEKYGKPAINGVVEITTKHKKEITFSDALNTSKESVVFVARRTKENLEQQQEPIFIKVENEPRFPGGDSAWKNYLIKNAKPGLPVSEGWKAGIYKIVVSFIAKKDGSIADIRTNDYAGSNTAEHCIDLIRKGPKWEPAIQNGLAVNCYKKQPITFVVEEQ